MNDTDESWNHAYLFVEESNIGRVHAKLHGESEFTLVSRINDPEAFLGEVQPGETLIDFRIVSLTEDSGSKYFAVPVYVGHDDGVFLPNYEYCREWDRLWVDCWEQYPLWLSDWGRESQECLLLPIPEELFLDDYQPQLWATEYAELWKTVY